jgi:hypothetical protein
MGPNFYREDMLNMLLTAAAVPAEFAGCLLTADFLSGALHWAEDSWLAPGRNALLDRWIVLPNIEHHERPGSIRQGTYWETNNVTIALAAGAALVCTAFRVQAWEVYLTLAIGSQSNQLHAWAHTARPPRIIGWLQHARILQSAKVHASHHRRPYGSHYCTTTNCLNPLLDQTGFWRALERIGTWCGATMVRATPARSGF